MACSCPKPVHILSTILESRSKEHAVCWLMLCDSETLELQIQLRKGAPC